MSSDPIKDIAIYIVYEEHDAIHDGYCSEPGSDVGPSWIYGTHIDYDPSTFAFMCQNDIINKSGEVNIEEFNNTYDFNRLYSCRSSESNCCRYDSNKTLMFAHLVDNYDNLHNAEPKELWYNSGNKNFELDSDSDFDDPYYESKPHEYIDYRCVPKEYKSIDRKGLKIWLKKYYNVSSFSEVLDRA